MGYFIRRPALGRFRKLYAIDRSTGCWMWRSVKTPLRYGYFLMEAGGKVVGAHRASYMLNVGPIPDGAQVLHRCDHRACVNPTHLFIGTQKDNMQDMKRKGRSHQPSRERLDRMATRYAKPFRLTDPNGVLVEGSNLNRFCRDHGLRASCIYAMKRGLIRQHKGWTPAA